MKKLAKLSFAALFSLSSLNCDILNLEEHEVDRFFLKNGSEERNLDYVHYGSKIKLRLLLNLMYYNPQIDRHVAMVTVTTKEGSNTIPLLEGASLRYRPFDATLGTRRIHLDWIGGKETPEREDDASYFIIYHCDSCG